MLYVLLPSQHSAFGIGQPEYLLNQVTQAWKGLKKPGGNFSWPLLQARRTLQNIAYRKWGSQFACISDHRVGFARILIKASGAPSRGPIPCCIVMCTSVEALDSEQPPCWYVMSDLGIGLQGSY